MTHFFKNLTALALISTGLTACGTADKLAQIGQEPPLSAIEDPTTQIGYQPVQMPMPTPTLAHYSPNSLWQSGRRTFFDDQRAGQIGDLVTVLVSITDTAAIANSTARQRNGSQSMGASGAVGSLLTKVLPSGADASAAVDLSGTGSSSGSGTVNRSETLSTRVSAVVTQLLPNGNLVIEGRQEVRVNFEVRELIVAGVIRPQDIAADNTIPSEKIAEARISYGGRGQITDVQQPRYGQQVLDIVLPF